MFETEARRKRIVDARACRQFAAKQLAVKVERRWRDGAAAEARRRIDPLRPLGSPYERRRIALDVGKQTRNGCVMRSSEPPEYRRCWAHFAVLDPRQGSATRLRSTRKVHRATSAARAAMPAGAQRGAHRQRRGVEPRFPYTENTLENESVKAPPQRQGASNLRVRSFSCTVEPPHNGMDRCRRRTTPPFRPGPGPFHCLRAPHWR